MIGKILSSLLKLSVSKNSNKFHFDNDLASILSYSLDVVSCFEDPVFNILPLECDAEDLVIYSFGNSFRIAILTEIPIDKKQTVEYFFVIRGYLQLDHIEGLVRTLEYPFFYKGIMIRRLPGDLHLPLVLNTEKKIYELKNKVNCDSYYEQISRLDYWIQIRKMARKIH
ncbi:MAG: hypothetical protein H7196_01065 [candidate division SR1 bacterium]|nr:hypothetical protein [candidate division SR1 bacterium]